MGKNDNLALFLAFTTTAGLCLGGIWMLNRAVPGLLPNLTSQPGTSGATQPQSASQLTILGDTFSGYSTFRNTVFQQTLKQGGIGLRYEDEFDQIKRTERLNQGQADLIVTTLDQFLKQQPQGKIVGLIDRTVGADAVVLNTRKYPKLKSLLDLNQLVTESRQQGRQLSIAFAGDTPSEYLALVLSTKFEALKLSDFQIIRVADASEAWKLLQDSSKNVPIAVIWEPYVTQARQQGNTVVLSSADAPGAIVDVIVASNRLIQTQPGTLSEFLETYYRQIDANARDAAQLQRQIAADGKLSSSDAGAILRGIEFFTAAEAKSWLTDGSLEKRIGSTAAVLTLAGRLKQVPPNPKDLFDGQFLTKAASNTQTLIDLIRADNPDLANRLAGKGKAIAPAANSVKATQLNRAPDVGNLQVRGVVGFGVGSANLTAEGKQTLQKLVQEVAEFNPQTIGVRVIGHTSRTGSVDFNQRLSKQRAQVVANYFRRKNVKNRLLAEGKGFSQPLVGVAPASSQNQRTEIRLVRIN